MKRNKKLLAIILAVSMLCSIALVGCTGGGKNVKAAGQVIIGTDTEANGDWSYNAFTSNPNATDLDVIMLTDDVTPVATNKEGDYVINDTVVKKFDREENDDSVTYTVTINKGMKFNNGDPITAANFLAWEMFITSKAGGDMGTVTVDYNRIKGGADWRAGTADHIEGLRMLADDQFSITVMKTGYDGNTYYPYYYDLAYVGLQPVNLDYWFGEGWEVKDDGEGAYFSNENGTEFTKDTVGDAVAAAQFATSDRVTCGAYNLVSFDKSANEITLEVNENYPGDFTGQKPGIAKIIIVRTEDETVIDNLSTGGIQIYSGIADGGQVNAAIDLIDQETIDSSYCEYDRAGYGYFGFACDLGPAQFTEFRQAIAHLLDRNEFANTFCEGWGGVVNGPYCTAFSMYEKSEDFIASELDSYEYSLDDAVALLKQAGFTLNADGSDYVDGSGQLRYKEVTAEQAENYDSFNVKLADGRILMPAVLNWASSEGNSVSDLLVTMLANGSATKEAGVEIKQTTMSFPELLNYMYRQDAYGIGGDYSVPTFNMFNLATGWSSGAYDFSYEFTTNPDYIAQGYNTTHCYDEELDRYSMDMVYGVEPEDEAKYLDLWQKFIKRYNELLPQVPLYSNIYVSIYPNTIKNYEEGPFWGFNRAILYATYVGEDTAE